MPFSDLCYDAASLLLERLQQVAGRDAAGNLIVGRAALDPATGNRAT